MSGREISQTNGWSRKVSAALGVAVITAALSISGALAADKVRVGKAVAFAFTFIPMEVGVQGGVWAKYGIEPVISSFRGDAKMQQGLTSNSIDFGLGSGPGMGFMAKGVPAKGVAAFAGPPTNLSVLIPYNTDIKSIADLKGKRIGVTTVGSLTDWLSKRMAMNAGWGVDGVRTVTIGGLAPSRAALKTGQVDAMMMATAIGNMLELKKEAKNLVNAATFVRDFHTHIIFARNEMIEKKPDVVRRFVNGWFATIAFMRANRDRTIEIANNVLRQGKPVLSRAYDQEMPMMSDDGVFDAKAVAVLKDSFVEMKILKTKPADDVLFTTRFVPAKP